MPNKSQGGVWGFEIVDFPMKNEKMDIAIDVGFGYTRYSLGGCITSLGGIFYDLPISC
jgi:hypothetical protein